MFLPSIVRSIDVMCQVQNFSLHMQKRPGKQEAWANKPEKQEPELPKHPERPHSQQWEKNASQVMTLK